MKKHTRLIAALLCMVMIILSLTSCSDLLNQVMSGDKGGSSSDILPHTCESKCPDCGNCLDESCDEVICRFKCECNLVQIHECISVCSVCGGCYNIECGDPACEVKCSLHHVCESACVDCGRCLDLECDADFCAVKCDGHHECESVCEYCGRCLDPECEYDFCAVKCDNYEDEAQKAKAYSYLPVISGEMAVIHINTADGDNSWATKYTRSSKLQGLIKYVDATITTDFCEDEYVISNIEAQVKVRGNYTLDYAKKPIRIKFKEKTNLLGLHDEGKYKNWVLLADWKDLSMTNNTLAFYLGNTILGSDGFYCTDFRNVEVYLNGKYWGVYLLAEQQEVKDDRTSASEVKKNYTGNDIGYFFEYDGYWNLEGKSYLEDGEGDPTFTLNHQGLRASNSGYTVKSDLYDISQLQFLQSYMNNVFYIAYQATYKDKYYKFNEDYTAVVEAPEITSAKEAVGRVIDLKSLVGTYILNELAKDLDIDWSSFYLSLDMSADGSKLLTFEAPWDFDSSFGLTWKDNCSPTEGIFCAYEANPWFQLVKDEEWFWEMVREKWAEMKEYNLFENAINFLKAEKETYKQYYINNYTKWSTRVTGGNTECVDELNTFKDIDTAQGLAVDYLIRWFTARYEWLDTQWSEQENGDNGGTENPDDNTTNGIPEDAVAYRYEAEYAVLGNFVVEEPIRVNKDYASNMSYVGNVATNTTITFTVVAESDITVYLFAGVSKRTGARDFAKMFSLTVNNVSVYIPSRPIDAISNGEEDYHSFVGVELVPITLKEGTNTIVFTTIGDATNFDYIDIYSTEALS